MVAALDVDRGVRAFRDAAQAWGLGYSVDQSRDIMAPVFVGSVSLDYAEAVR
jgi:hypothetical protein